MDELPTERLKDLYRPNPDSSRVQVEIKRLQGNAEAEELDRSRAPDELETLQGNAEAEELDRSRALDELERLQGMRRPRSWTGAERSMS